MKTLIFSLSITSLLSAEIDSWTRRNEVMQSDSSMGIINTQTRSLLDQGVARANASGNCDKMALYKSIYREAVGVEGFFHGTVLEHWSQNDDSLNSKRICTQKQESPYRDFGYSEAPGLNLVERAMGCTFNLKGNLVGSDKLGHFFAQGWSYFRKVEIEKRPLSEALEYGHNSELTYFGLQSTGVYSYGDLAANYEGMNFFTNLAGGSKPYYACKEGQWVSTGRQFDWGDYISEAWDEAKNPSVMKTQEMHENKLRNRVAKLGMRIPLGKRHCVEIEKKYQKRPEVLKSIMSPECQKFTSTKTNHQKRDLFNYGSYCMSPVQLSCSLFDALCEIRK